MFPTAVIYTRDSGAIVSYSSSQVETLKALHEEVAKCRDSVTLKVIPALHDPPAANQVTSSLHPDSTKTIVSVCSY